MRIIYILPSEIKYVLYARVACLPESAVPCTTCGELGLAEYLSFLYVCCYSFTLCITCKFMLHFCHVDIFAYFVADFVTAHVV